MPEITVHWLEKSRSQRINWLLEELKLDYNLHIYKRDPETLRAEVALAKIHPLGKSPIVEVDGKILGESGLIIDYLISKFGKDTELAPKSEDEELNVKYYLHHCEGSLQPDLLLLLVSQRVREKAPYLLKTVAQKVADGQDAGFAHPDLEQQLKFLESKLKENGTGFFVGDHLTGADIIYSFPLLDSLKRGYADEKNHPNILKWLDSIQSRPAYKKAVEKSQKALNEKGQKM